ncbi:MAG: hypothetical protein AB7F31_06970 [Parachlamydiales bacterium]
MSEVQSTLREDWALMVQLRTQQTGTKDLVTAVEELGKLLAKPTQQGSYQPLTAKDLTEAVTAFDAATLLGELGTALESAYGKVVNHEDRPVLPEQEKQPDVAALKQATDEELSTTLGQLGKPTDLSTSFSHTPTSSLKDLPTTKPQQEGSLWTFPQEKVGELTQTTLDDLDKWLEYREWKDPLEGVSTAITSFQKMVWSTEENGVKPAELLDQQIESLKEAVAKELANEEGSLKSLYDALSKRLDERCNPDNILVSTSFRVGDPKVVKGERDELHKRLNPTPPPSRSYPWLLLAAGLGIIVVAIVSTERLRSLLKWAQRTIR